MKLREIKNVKFFIDWLNKERGRDFVIDESFNDEQSHIDVVVKSKKLAKTLNIQNVAYRDGTLYKYGTSNIPGLKPLFVLGEAMSDIERKESILKCITDKENKYPKSPVNNLVLLIEITIPAITPEQIKKLFSTKVESNFMGIYFVQLPVMTYSVEDVYGKTGYVYPLKEISIL